MIHKASGSGKERIEKAHRGSAAATGWGWFVGLLLLAGCYDAPRTNPFDPALTPAVELLSVTVDSTRGSATLEWSPYAGKQPFKEYRVLRKVPGLEAVDTVAAIADVRQTSYRDTTLQPMVVYGYWVEVVNQGGFEVESGKQEGVVYALPSIALLEANFSSDTATAGLVWTQYRGPGFAVYEVRRKAPELEEKAVAEMEVVSDTTYTDTFLDGNTEYTYHIVVRTGWEGVEVSSNEKSGRFYPFDHSFELPEVPSTEPQAVGLAVDEQDRLYVGMTLISASRAGAIGGRVMREGIQLRFPDQSGVGSKRIFDTVRPSLFSPLYLTADRRRIYVCFVAEDEIPRVGALNENGETAWLFPVETTNNASPVGLYHESTGDLFMVDREALLYSFDPEDGDLQKKFAALQSQLTLYQSQLVNQVLMEPGFSFDGGDLFFLLNREHRDHHLLVRRRSVNRVFDQTWINYIDAGIGLGDGQTLTPLVMAFDPQRARLLVLEAQGRLLVFDARPDVDVESRYITQWGGFGSGDGEFQLPVPISAAMVVDSQGVIYVADGTRRVQVFAP